MSAWSAASACAASPRTSSWPGTGSGKSLSYIVPIVYHVLRTGSGGGVKAIVVYPMNALANSQREELDKFLRHGPWGLRPPVTYARYTGQEEQEERARIQESPPDILLTNYVMLELILTRVRDRRLAPSAQMIRSVHDEVCRAERIRELERQRRALRHPNFDWIERERHGRVRRPRGDAAIAVRDLAELLLEAAPRRG